jgi:membrane-associated phospholipid phosphatase
MSWRRPRDVTPHDGWMSQVSSGLALAGFLWFVFAGFTLLAMGPLESLDAYFNVQPAPPGWVPVLHIMDRIGQRAVCLPILAVVTIWCCRRQESWRPAWVVAISVFMLNLIVLVLKVGLGRAEPVSADPSFFEGGMAYPSGHTANIVLVYGLCAFLLGRYGGLRRGVLRAMWAVVVMLSVVMVVTSVTLRWHWFADLLAGLIVGGAVLTMTEAVDAAVPGSAFRDGWRAVLRKVRPHRERPVPPAVPPVEANVGDLPSTVPRREAP